MVEPADELEPDCGRVALPDTELEELGVEGVALDEDELGELGVVALPDTELELEPGWRLVASLDDPALELDVAPGPLAPRLASPSRSQP